MSISLALKNGSVIRLDRSCHRPAIGHADGFTFKVLLSGKQQFSWQSKQLTVYPDSFIILEPGTDYQSETGTFHKHADILTLDYSKSLLTEQIIQRRYPQPPIPGIYPFRGDMRYTIQNLVRQLYDPGCQEQLINNYLEHILINYYRLYHEEVHNRLQNLSFVKENTRKEIFGRLVLAREYILQNYSKRFSIEDLAAYSCLSVNHLLRTFKQAYGLTPFQYLTIVRLNRAKTYLCNGEYSINQTVMMVGFESVSSFIKLFKTTFNTTPLKFKKQILSEQNIV